ncbi:hypothetical protein MYIN104542_01580 [Mycobacterium intermedium]
MPPTLEDKDVQRRGQVHHDVVTGLVTGECLREIVAVEE